jgi:GPI mannosyltransferase 3
LNLKKLFALALLLHVLSAWFSIGRFHADEQFQVLEFAAYKNGENAAADLPWEFHEKIRPAIQPALACVVINAAGSFGIQNPFTHAFILRLLSSLLALLSVWFLLSWFKGKLPDKLFNALTFLSLFWCFIPWFHARFSSENISASLFFIGFFGYLRNETNNKKIRWIFICGVLCGLAGVVRFQTNFFLFGFFLWIIFIQKEKIKSVILFVFGILFANLGGILIDKWFYGTWEITAWNYVYQNIILHKAEQFGKEPIWYFAEHTLTEVFPPFSLFILFSFCWVIFRKAKSPFTWIIVPFLLAHLISAHKELRFLFPLITLVPVAAILAFDDITSTPKFATLQQWLTGKTARVVKSVFVVSNFVLLAYFTLKPADDYTSTLKFLYNNYNSQNVIMVNERKEVDPYSKEIALNFYKSKTITSVDSCNLDSLRLANPGKTLIYTSDNNSLSNLQNYQMKKVYSSFPEFLFRFNFNNWTDRVNKVFIYEISPAK